MIAAGTVRRFSMLSIVVALAAPCARAASVAARNTEGNRLFQQGKYQEAEKAYVDAQLEAPGRPELLYNLGNTLLKQKKYEPALQSLHQAAGKAERGLQANSWYNLGNAFFESGKFQEAAQSFIQTLRINPSDRDAKHNLELTLRRMKEQKQNASEKGSNSDQQKNGEGKQNPQDAKSGQQDRKDDQKPGAQEQQNTSPQRQRQQSQAERRDGSMTKDRALQILDAMKDQELAEQRKLQERQARHKANGRDW